MLIDQKITIRVDPKLDRTYFKLGYYDKNEFKDPFDLEIDIKDLISSSRIYVNVKCDICGIEKSIQYVKYNENIKNWGIYACSPKCASFKNKLTCKEKYGDENYNNRDKCKVTCVDLYGVDNVQKNKEIKQKSVNTIKNSYGYEPIMQKVRNKNLENHGKEHALQIDEFYQKSLNTKKERYGDENYNNRNKCKVTCMDLYGVDNVQKSAYMMEKKKNKILLENPDIISIDDHFNYTIKCDNNQEHNYEIYAGLYYNRKLSKTICCTECNPPGSSKSGTEILLYNFIKENYNGLILKDKRTIIPPKEIDIYLPELKIGFEYNSLYYHCENFVDEYYHYNKTEIAEEMGINLVHIYEDDWLYKQDIVKSRILNIISKTSNKIFARKCEIREIENNQLVVDFLNINHIQGFVGSKFKIGLFYDNELVSLMTFGSLRVSMGQDSVDGSYEMLRFCNKLNTNVIGGASRLFKYFFDKYKPIEIISYADRSWSIGELYLKLGFKLIHKTKPNYYYIVDGIRRHRFNFRKDKLVKEGADPNKTEHEIMLERGLFRIYDSGSYKFQFLN